MSNALQATLKDGARVLGLDLSEAQKQRFSSMHDCFTRELKDGARPVSQDVDAMTSPVDAIVGASGPIEGTRVFQAKGFPYTLQDLLGSEALAQRYGRDEQQRQALARGARIWAEVLEFSRFVCYSFDSCRRNVLKG